MFGSSFRDSVSQEQGQSSKIFKKSDSRDSGAEEEFEILESNNQEETTRDRRRSGDSGNESQEESEVLGDESQGIPDAPYDTPPEDLSLENEILANFPDGCNRSFTVESEDEGLYVIVPENLTFAEITNILNQATKENNFEELDKVVRNIEDYEGRSITLDSVNLKSFCEKQLNLDLRDESDHRHICLNILSKYNFDQENFNCDYSVKELVLLAIAASDKLAEKYQDILFAEGNLSLLPLLVGNQKYIEAFIEKFRGTDEIYDKLKDQSIQLDQSNKIGFFSVIALRKEQELLNTVFVEYVLRDFGQVLKTSKPDPLYGVLETASLVKNEEFIPIVLGAFERYINEPTKKASTEELLKKSFATLLETAISQEHISVIKYLCKRYTNSAGHAIYDVYEQAFADDKVITILRQQILKNIGTRGRREIYDLILKAALDAGNIAFIEHLCKECAECSNDVIGYLNQKFKNNEFDNIHESILIALSNVEYTNTDVIVEVLFYTKEIHQNVSHNEQVIRQVIQNILKNATHYSIGQEDYSLVKGVCYLCTEIDAINIIFREECGIFKSSIEKRIEDLEKENKLLQSEALREYNSRLPGIVNGLVQTACIVYDEYTKDPKDNKRQENTDLIFSLTQIRNILQFSIDMQEYPCHERQDLWDEMYQTPGTFIIRKRSNNVADELEIPVITSDILSENPEPESAGSKQVEEDVFAGEKKSDTLSKIGASTKPISNSCKEGEMPNGDKNIKNIEEALSDVIFSLGCKEVRSLVEQVKQEGNNVERIINGALKKANQTKVGKKDKKSRNKLIEIRKFLEEELSSISDNVGDIGATASSHEAHVNIDDGEEQESAESGSKDDQRDSLPLSSPNLVSNDERSSASSNPSSEYVVIPSGSGSSSPIQGIVNEEEPVLDATNSRDGSTLEGDGDKQEPQPLLSPLSSPSSSSFNDADLLSDSESNSDFSDDEEESLLGTENGRNGSAPEDDGGKKDAQPIPAPVPPVDNTKSKRENDAKSNGRQSENNKDTTAPSVNIEKSTDNVQADTTSPVNSNGDGEQPGVLEIPIPEQNSVVQPTNPGNGGDTTPSTNEQNSASVPLVDKTSGQVKDAQGSNKKLSDPKSTKSSKWPVIAVSTLVVAAVVSVAISVYLEMLMVGIAVGACCLAAAIIYYCKPASSVENSNTQEGVANYCTTVS